MTPSTMTSMISLPSEIDVSKLEFGPVKLMENGGKTVSIRYEGHNIITETPSLNVPYGLNVFDKTPGAPVKYSIDLSFRGVDENESIKALQTFFEEFDERMIDAGVENANKWFKMSNPNRDVIKAFYTPMLKYSKDASGQLKPYPPTFKLALRRAYNKNAAKGSSSPAPTGTAVSTFDSKFYDPTAPLDAKGEIAQFPKDTELGQILVKRSQTTAIIQCTGVWFAGGKFGSTWKAMQFRMDSRPEQISGPAFRSEAPDIRAFVAKNVASAAAATSHPYEDAEEEEEEEDDDDGGAVAAVLPKKAAVAPAPLPVQKPVSSFAEEAVAEPVPVPKKVVKKTTVAKAK